MFRRRIVVVVVVEDGLGECANLESVLKKNYFHTTRVRSRLAYLEDAPFPICF
jgi:hypothetical protein